MATDSGPATGRPVKHEDGRLQFVSVSGRPGTALGEKGSQMGKMVDRLGKAVERDKTVPRQDTLTKIQRALESAGIEFINSDGPGARLKSSTEERTARGGHATSGPFGCSC